MHKILFAGLSALLVTACTNQARVPDYPQYYTGQVWLLAATYCPRNTVPAQGQILEISDNPELFSLYGTRFGGDGRTTFGLPDLRGRSAMARGQGPGRDPVSIGQVGGREYAGILPQHSHSLLASPQSAELPAPSMAMLPSGDSSSPNRYSLPGPTSGTQLHPDVIQPAGNANAGTRLYQPVIALQYCIVTRGAYPPRTTQGDPE